MSVVLAFAGSVDDPTNAAWLRNATLYVAFAGPDVQRSWSNGVAGLGHAALHASIDTPSVQPLTLDGRVWISADVRLDDRDTLRHALASHGRRIPPDADDARLVLDAYLAWGERCVDRLAGDFAFAVWDDRVRRLFCARDQMGVVALYYSASGNRLCVSGALDGLRLRDDVDDALDEQTVGDFLVAGLTSDASTTIYAAIRQLPPAHTLTWEDGRVTVRRYWDVPAWNGFERLTSASGYAERFRDVLRAAIADRTRAHHVGVQLSGGLDSTSIAAIAREVSRDAATPFTMRAYTGTLHSVMPEREGEYAALVGRHLGVDIDWIDIADYGDVDPLATPAVVLPEPNHYRRTALEHEFVRRPMAHGRVVLSGLGADPLLAHEPSYWLDWIARGQIGRTTAAFSEHARLFGRLPVPGLRTGLRHAMWRVTNDTPPVADWIDHDFVRRADLASRLREIWRTTKSEFAAPGLATAPHWSALLACGHPAFTGAPVRFRHPFFDLRLLSLAIALPPKPWLMDKRILRDATRDLLPEAVRQRPKAPLPNGPVQALRTARGVQHNLIELVEIAPQLDRFVDRARLRSTVEAETVADYRYARAHVAALGFAHWLQHRPRPQLGPAVVGSGRSNAVERLAAVPV